jgi:hypothetical protein
VCGNYKIRIIIIERITKLIIHSFTNIHVTPSRALGICETLRFTSVSWSYRQSVGLLGHKYPYLKWNSNPRTQCPSGRRVLWIGPRGHSDRQWGWSHEHINNIINWNFNTKTKNHITCTVYSDSFFCLLRRVTYCSVFVEGIIVYTLFLVHIETEIMLTSCICQKW